MSAPQAPSPSTGKRQVQESSEKLFVTPAAAKRQRTCDTPGPLRAPGVALITEEWIRDDRPPMAPGVLRCAKECLDKCKRENPDGKVIIKTIGIDPDVSAALLEIKIRFGKPRIPKAGQKPGNVKQPGPSFETFARARAEIAVVTNEEATWSEVSHVGELGSRADRFQPAFIQKIKNVIQRRRPGVFVWTEQVLDIVRSELAEEHAYNEYASQFIGVRGRFGHFIACNDDVFEIAFRRTDTSSSAIKLRC